MSEPTAVEAADLFGFIGSSRAAVVLVSVHPRHAFSRTLAGRLAADHQDMALGTVSLPDLLLRGGPALRFLHQGLRACGAPNLVGVLPGYYLFRGGSMLAWDAGLPSFSDIEAICPSALLGLFWSSLTRDAAFLRQALHAGAEQVAAHRVAAFFARATVQEEASRRARGPSRPPPADQVSWAYQVLGVPPTATDREVHAAWRQRRREHHPDQVMNDVAEFDRRSRISAEINHARDVVLNERVRAARS